MTDTTEGVGRKRKTPNRNAYARKWQAAKYASDPLHRANLLARQKERYARLSKDPEWKRKQNEQRSAARKAKYASDPTHKQKIVDASRAWRARVGSAWRRSNRFMRDYGITLAVYDAMWSAQGGACAICKRIFDTWLHVDHQHVPGYDKLTCAEKAKFVRGLLCRECNRGIAHFSDDPAVLRAAADFLEASQRKPQH